MVGIQRVLRHIEGIGSRRPVATAADSLKPDLVWAALRSPGRVHLRVRGASMLPALWPGDILTVSRGDADPIRAGEIVSFMRGGRIISHRVTRVLAGQVVTRGDSARQEDAAVQPGEILGKVSAIVHGRKTLPATAAPSRAARAGAWCLRRSGFGTRVVLRLYGLWRRAAGPAAAGGWL